MILNKQISFIDKTSQEKRLARKIFKLDFAIDRVVPYFLETLTLDTDFKPLPALDRPIYISGSGASLMQAQFLAELLQRYLGLPARFYPPFSLKTGFSPRRGETVIFFSQKLSQTVRNLIDYFNRLGINIIVFTARGADNLEEEITTYKFLPYHSFNAGEKMIVPVIGPISSYLQIIKFIRFLISCYGSLYSPFELHVQDTIEKIQSSKSRFKELSSKLNPDLLDIPVIIISSGIYMAAANHMALTLTEGALIEAHAYEIENYTHGLRFYDRNKPRLFIVLNNPAIDPYYQAVYP